ncbi:MAG: VOC family protein [Alphaproteobacteria bacterium]|nr:MAG: VOC family protein [Alphaproteobacteria bacterium]
MRASAPAARRNEMAQAPSSLMGRQLPLGEEIFLDHIGHFVPDMEAATRALARAGFAPTPVSIQVNPDPGGGAPRLTGTGNVTAMLAQGYLEVLFKTADTPLVAELEAESARYPGMHLVAFAAADAAAAHARLAAAGFRVRALVKMQRPVDVEGAPGTAAFTPARVEPGEMPEGRIQILTHHTERAVWQPRWLSHPNGALALTRVVIAVADVEEAAQRFGRFTGRMARPSPFGRSIELDRGHLDLVSVDGFQQMLPEISLPSIPFMGACEIRVASLAALRDRLRQARLETFERPQSLVVRFPAEIGDGAWLFKE